MSVFFSSRRRHTRFDCDWSSDVCSSDLVQHGRRESDGIRQCGDQPAPLASVAHGEQDRKSTRLNSSHSQISYAVFCLKKKKKVTNLLITNIIKHCHLLLTKILTTAP